MILGLSYETFTVVHVILSLVGIAARLTVLLAMIAGKHFASLTAVFLATTVLTSVTGFPLPPFGFDPPRAFGVISLVLLTLSIAGLYAFRLAGPWRSIYVVTAAGALYLNCFVAVVQTFQKVAFFNALAPTQTELPFAIAQGLLLLVFIALTVLAVKRFPRGAAAT